MGWLIFEGEEGINAIFDEESNKSKKHIRDDALIPFKTKVDKNRYEDFSGVVGAFSRLMSDTMIKGGVKVSDLHSKMKEKLEECEPDTFDLLAQIVDNLYFEKGKLLPINTKALNYIDYNISQQQVAEYLYSMFVEATDLKGKYALMEQTEDTNVLESLVFSSLEDTESKAENDYQRADCFLPYVKDVFIKDLSVLLENSGYYKANIERFLAYYYYYYISQLAVKLNKFELGKRGEIEKIYMSLNWEVVTRVRPSYEYGWKYVKEKISHMFSHSVILGMMSRNNDGSHLDYIGLFERMNNSSEDSETASDINSICETYKKWIPLDYSSCKHDDSKDGSCQAMNAIRMLFETIDFQFINGGRKSHYNGYNKKFIEFAQKVFGKWRGTNGYTIGLWEEDVIMFTKIIIAEYNGKVRLSKLFEEFEKRGILFDRESKKKVTDLFEKMNLLEKRSDSGDAQYVKSVL